MGEPAEHVTENRRYWDERAADWIESGERLWDADPQWGVWGVPETELQLLPNDLAGQRAIELGCGTGYVSGWIRARGATVYAIDNSEQQLATARRLAAERGVDDIEWVHGDAEAVPQPDHSFDLAISEYGAAIWCDPFVWVPEAHRLLRDGGELVFFGSHPWTIVCANQVGDTPVGERLERDYFGLRGADWRDAAEEPGGIEFNLPLAEWLALFRHTGFDLLDYIEVQAPATATGERFWTPAAWAQRWPAEHAWKLRKR